MLLLTAASGLNALWLTEARAGDCGPVAVVTSDLWDRYLELDPELPQTERLRLMIAFWQASERERWAQIGPRRLAFKREIEGVSVGSGAHIFIAATPTDNDGVALAMERLAGRGHASVTICRVSRSGRRTSLWTGDLPERDSTTKKPEILQLSGLSGEILTVYVKPSAGLKTLSFRLRVDER